jgi:hypothetical protein
MKSRALNAFLSFLRALRFFVGAMIFEPLNKEPARDQMVVSDVAFSTDDFPVRQ